MHTKAFLAAAVVAAMFAPTAPTAHADSTDDQFLAALDQAGITSSSPDKAIAAGKAVCKMSGDQGMSTINVDIAIHNANPKLTWDQAVQFVNIATDAYCPPAPSTETTS